jgi:6-phosphogluconolactonase
LSPAPVVVYASEGRALHAFGLDPEVGSLSLRSSIELPEPVQYAALDARRPRLYVSASDRDTRHFVAALAIDAATGALTPLGEPIVPADGRVIHLSVDAEGRHLVLAHPLVHRLSVLALRGDGSIAAPVTQAEDMDTGFFAHQAKLDPDGRGLVACAMGADAAAQGPEKPGVLTAYRYDGGQLTRTGRVTLGAGLGPRHLDYARGRVYVAVERGNRLAVFDYAGGALAPEPRFVVDTLAQPSNVRPSQRAGAIRFHPNRRWLYVTNRANAADVHGAFAGGENNVALFDVDPQTGRPEPRGHFDTGGIEPRTFTVDPTGRFLVVANHSPLGLVPRSWTVFRIADDGRLELARKYDRATADLFWIGSVALSEA